MKVTECKYRTGKVLGSGSFAIVKEAIRMDTGKIYAAKVINKKLVTGREYMVRNEITVLKKISDGHESIVSLRDYFETRNNIYIIFDICSGGRLLDRICARGHYCELDAVDLVRTIFDALAYIHDLGIVHRDLKPENLLFRTKDPDSLEIMIADFGLSRMLDNENLHRWTEMCGTPSYMAPEVYTKRGYGTPVDIWAMGVITYMILSGNTPFERSTQEEEIDSIIAGDYKFEPRTLWGMTTDPAKDFIERCLRTDPKRRPTAREMLRHSWLTEDIVGGHAVHEELLPHIKKAFGISTSRKAALLMKRMNDIASGSLDSNMQKLEQQLKEYKKESEEEMMEDEQITHRHQSEPHTPLRRKYSDESEEKLKKVDDLDGSNDHVDRVDHDRHDAVGSGGVGNVAVPDGPDAGDGVDGEEERKRSGKGGSGGARSVHCDGVGGGDGEEREKNGRGGAPMGDRVKEVVKGVTQSLLG